MSANIQQIFLANPITTNQSTDLMYFGQSPFGAGNDAAMTFADFSLQFPVLGSALSASQAVVTNASSQLVSMVYTPGNTANTLVSRSSTGGISVVALTAATLFVSTTNTANIAIFSNSAVTGCYASFVSNGASTQTFVGTDGAALANIQNGALILATDPNNNLPVYITPGTSTTWGLKVATGSVVNTFNNTLDGGAGTMILNGTAQNLLTLNSTSSATIYTQYQQDNTGFAYFGYSTSTGCSILNGGNTPILKQLTGTSSDTSVLTANNTLDDGTGRMICTNVFPWGFPTAFVPATGDQTILATNLIGGLIISPIQSTPFIWNLDTGANIYAEMGNPPLGTCFTCLLSNNNNAPGAVMTIGASSTGLMGRLRGLTLPNNTSMLIYFVVSDVDQITLYS